MSLNALKIGNRYIVIWNDSATTYIYTLVSLDRLRSRYQQAHPRA